MSNYEGGMGDEGSMRRTVEATGALDLKSTDETQSSGAFNRKLCNNDKIHRINITPRQGKEASA